MSCIPEITADIAYDCNDKGITGLDGAGVLINRKDIDFSAIVRNADKTVVTALPLLSGKSGFTVDSIKNLNTANAEFVKGDADNGHKQSFLGRYFKVDADALKNINAMSHPNAEFVYVAETKFKGSDMASAFKIFGLDVGLKLQEGKYGSGENKGAYTFVLGSEDGFEEPNPFYFLQETDYATTKARHVAKYASA